MQPLTDVELTGEQRLLLLSEQMEDLREDLEDLKDEVAHLSRQGDFVVQYMQLIAEEMGIRARMKQLDVEYERNKAEMKRLRERPRKR